MSREMRGTGTLLKRGRVWWLQYSIRGRVYRESSHSDDKTKAQKVLNSRLEEGRTKGCVLSARAEKVTLQEMKDALLTSYRLAGNRSIETAEHFAANLLAYFGEEARALDIDAGRIDQYIEARQKAGLANASINRETSCLRHMFFLMVKANRLSRDHVPAVTRLAEAPPRRGFLEPAEFAKLRDALPGYLRDPATFLYLTGWRKGAMRSLIWSRDVELEQDDDCKIVGGTIRLQPENSKNKRGWTLRLTGELLEVVRRAWANRKPECPYIFQNDGAPIGDFRKSWQAAREAVGLDGLLVHDMRRSCARNLVRSGVPERVAMAVTGHLTRSMFDRYNIVAESDLESAMARVSDYVSERMSERAKARVLRLPVKVRAA
jgi:integrase